MAVRLAQLALLVLSVLLGACATRAPVPQDREAAWEAHEAQAARLAKIEDWYLSGKLSVDDGEDGGSGRLDWAVNGDRARLEFVGALGRGAWNLDIRTDGARLEKADGKVVQAATVDELVEFELGWRIPVNALQRWVLGLPAEDAPAGLSLGTDGKLHVMTQHGWRIEYERYRGFQGFDLPTRLEATRGERRVKLAIVDWQPVAGTSPDG